MIKKLVHFSDLHIRLFKDHDLYRSILIDMLNQFREIQPDRIVFTGDLVHSKNQMTPELIEFVAWILTECSKIAKTVLIIGNHDFLENNMSRLDALTPIIDSLQDENIAYLKSRGEYEDENVDWVVFSLMDHNIPPDIEKTGRVKFDSGFDSDKFKGCDLVLCGDIHKRQVFNIPNGKKAYMVGSTIQQNYGETLKNHGYGIYDVINDTYEFVELENPKPFLSFKIKSFEDILNGDERLANA
jgi:DNA repair exonuclease SbcCD nuclease subunit